MPNAYPTTGATQAEAAGAAAGGAGATDVPLEVTLAEAAQWLAEQAPRTELPVKRKLDPKEVSVWGEALPLPQLTLARDHRWR